MPRRAVPPKGRLDGDIDLGALRTFVAIAQTGSFANAGKALGITRSAAGKAMARLEVHLGARLLHRTTRRVSMTADGQTFYERCVQILNDLEEAQASVRDRPHLRGTLRLTVTEAYGRIVIIPFLKQFLLDWPDLNVEISFTDRIVDLVEEGFDLGIRVGGVAADAQLVARVIAKARPYVYAAPSYLELYGTPQDIAQLERHQRLIFGLRPGLSAWQMVDGASTPVTVNGPTRLRFDSGEAIRKAAINGIGIAYLPSFIAEPDVVAGRLVRLFPDHGGPEIPVYAVYPNRKHLAAKSRLFIDQLIATTRGG
ncbi:LysR family transcriptional regulator [Pseudomonas typographi]|uniref:LysR family transcriptional regulator n=1 Tax=Pseudomonas typographi TaxID=2715964 RepID=UPI0016898397|nr:LysR family transcriptional regulator [Pseudomonas typographi]MBD1554453.1 LysR family transcriptional regulator [Pseudomonas typographi]MBD1589941.1 LysR family transcriptional regulator [Pseudomonas typographi]